MVAGTVVLVYAFARFAVEGIGTPPRSAAGTRSQH